MKSRSLFLHSLFAAAVATVTISSAFAANVTWDPTPGTPTGDGTITGGTGSWRNLGNAYSWTINGGVTNIEWNNANNDTAIFGGTAGTVSIIQNPSVTAGGLTFNSDGYIVNTTNSRRLILSGSATVTVTNSGHTATISLPIDGTSGLTKAGAGTLVLSSGTSTYSGATNVNAGTLAINGNHTTVTGALTVANVATLTGSGTVGGAATIQGGGIHAAGNGGIGKQTLAGGVNYQSGSIFQWQLGATAKDSSNGARSTDYDAVDVTNSSLSGSGAVFAIILNGSQTFADTFWGTSHNWTNIFTSNGTTALNYASIFSSFTYSNTNLATLDPTGRGSFSISGSTLSWSAVPEPGSALAGLLLGAGLLRRRRKD